MKHSALINQFLGRFWAALLLGGFLLSLSPAPVHAENSGLDSLIHKVDRNRRLWLAIRSDITIDFRTQTNRYASCRGKLLYQRLDEKLLLTCLNAAGKTLFVFKASDRNFELYLPDQLQVFRGNIFDLEDSPVIESHIKPLDLYRALKPLSIPSQNTRIVEQDEASATLLVYGKRHWKDYLSREVTITAHGLVPAEVYYSFDEKPLTAIYRDDYRFNTRPDDPEFKRILFPHRITIESKDPAKESVFYFENVEFLTSLAPDSWLYSIPPNTEITTFKRLGKPHSSGELVKH